MATAQIVQVRRFNRLATQRAGALDDHFLGRDRPLGESRVLFEIGPRAPICATSGRGSTSTRGI